MQAWAVHVQAETIDKACEAVADLYIKVQAKTPLVGYAKNFVEFGCSACVVVDVSSSQALREIQHRIKVDWVMMAALGIVMVVGRPSITRLEYFYKFISLLD